MQPWEVQADLEAFEHLGFWGDPEPETFAARYGLVIPPNRGYRQGRSITDTKVYALCPFHQEKSASFVMYRKHLTRSGRVHTHCFGCQWDGDLVAVIARMNGYDRDEYIAAVFSGEIKCPFR